jgi:hypothetical protein
VEAAYREQMAGHNALLLFVATAAGMMEERLRVAAADEKAVAAEVGGTEGEGVAGNSFGERCGSWLL